MVLPPTFVSRRSSIDKAGILCSTACKPLVLCLLGNRSPFRRSGEDSTAFDGLAQRLVELAASPVPRERRATLPEQIMRNARLGR
jgi:hypothetical protein